MLSSSANIKQLKFIWNKGIVLRVGVSFLCYKKSKVSYEFFFRQMSKADYRGSWKIRERSWSLTAEWQNVSTVKPNQGRHGVRVTCWVKQAGPLVKTEKEVTWACVSAKGYVHQLLKQITPRLSLQEIAKICKRFPLVAIAAASPFQWTSPGGAPWSIQCFQEGVGSHLQVYSAGASAHRGFRCHCAPSLNNLSD